MFEIPSKKDIKSVIINEDAVDNNKSIKMIHLSEKEIEEREKKKEISLLPNKDKK
jgi:hypothetical protein